MNPEQPTPGKSVVSTKLNRVCQYSAFLFDLYGTLVDIHTDERKPTLWKQTAVFFHSHGAVWEPEALHRAYLAGVYAEEDVFRNRDSALPYASSEIDLIPVFTRLYAEKSVQADHALISETAWFFRRASTSHLRLYSGAIDLLDVLRKQGKVLLLSNAQSLFTRPELDLLGLTGHFDGIYISSDVGFRKPDPRFFRRALERESLNASQCLMIGNDPVCDGLGARNVGMESFIIRSALSPRGETEGYDQVGMNLKKFAARYIRQA